MVNRPLLLDHKVRLASFDSLNQILADTMTLRDMYKKHHWQVSGPPFTNSISSSTSTTVNRLRLSTRWANASRASAELPFAMAHDVAEKMRARAAGASGDDGTNDLLVSDVLRANELQVWFSRDRTNHADRHPVTLHMLSQA